MKSNAFEQTALLSSQGTS